MTLIAEKSVSPASEMSTWLFKALERLLVSKACDFLRAFRDLNFSFAQPDQGTSGFSFIHHPCDNSLYI